MLGTLVNLHLLHGGFSLEDFLLETTPSAKNSESCSVKAVTPSTCYPEKVNKKLRATSLGCSDNFWEHGAIDKELAVGWI